MARTGMGGRNPQRPQRHMTDPTTTEEGRKRIAQAVSESALQDKVIEVCHVMGHLVFHDPDARRCRHCHQMVFDKRARGFPDLVILRLPGLRRRGPLVIFAELKTERGALSHEQKVWRSFLETIAKVVPGVAYYLWKPTDINDVIRLLADRE